jgi:hypothetical protein
MESLLRALGDLIRILNEAHICHRDLSLRNVIVPPPGDGAPDQPILWLIDLNRVLISDFASWRPSLAARNVTRLRLADDEFEHVLRAVFPNESQFAANRARFENARARHVAYKRIKKVPRETLTRGNS